MMKSTVGLLLVLVSVGVGCILPSVADPSTYVQSNLKSAERMVMMDALRKGHGRSLPADYVEYAIKLDFPDGSPIPGIQGAHPDLELKARNRQADSVDHLSFGTDSMIYFAELKMGQTYDVFIRGSGSVDSELGSIASIYVQPGLSRQQAIKITYRRATRSGAINSAPVSTRDRAPATSDKNWRAPAGDQRWHAPTSDQGWRSPTSDQGWHSPSVGPGYQSPGSK